MDSSNDDWVYIPGTRYREYVGMVARGVWSACVCVVVCGVQCDAVAAVQVVHCPLCIPPVLRYRRKTVEGVLRWWLVRVGVVLFTLAGRLPTCRGARKPLQQAIGSYLLAGNDNLATEPGDRDAPRHMLSALLLLTPPGASAQQQTVCATGFIMDTFCTATVSKALNTRPTHMHSERRRAQASHAHHTLNTHAHSPTQRAVPS